MWQCAGILGVHPGPFSFGELVAMAWYRGAWAQGYTAQLLCMIQRAVSGKGKVEDFLPDGMKRKRRASSPEEFERWVSQFPEYKPPTNNG